MDAPVSVSAQRRGAVGRPRQQHGAAGSPCKLACRAGQGSPCSRQLVCCGFFPWPNNACVQTSITALAVSNSTVPLLAVICCNTDCAGDLLRRKTHLQWG
jgi:hypothetical protein